MTTRKHAGRWAPVVLGVLAALGAGTRAAAADRSPRELDFVARDVVFTSGERLAEVRLHYRLLGTPHRDERGRIDNAVLLLHGTGGTGAQFLQPQFAGELFGEGQVLDAGRHFLILPDNLGHGGSSKPSDGLRQRFPRYGYADMVSLQHRLLTEGLGVHHLRLVLGTSMGGMHAWMWGYTYPELVDAIVPLASVPTAIVGRNRVWRKSLMDTIRDDPAWAGGDYREPPQLGLRGAQRLLVLMGAAPIQWQRESPTREAADAFLDAQIARRLPTADANDMLYQFDASRDYDPAPHLGRITAPVLAINSADDLINPPELGLVEQLLPRVRRSRYVLVPASERTRGHSTHTWAALWKEALAAFLAAPPSAPGADGLLRGSAATGVSGPNAAAADAEATVRAREHELLAAIGSADLDAYDRLVADDYVALRAAGDQTKAQVMATYRAGGLAYRGLDVASLDVRVFGDTAVVSAHTLGSRIENGVETPNRVRYLRVWSKREGAWRAVLQMATPLPPAP